MLLTFIADALHTPVARLVAVLRPAMLMIVADMRHHV